MSFARWPLRLDEPGAVAIAIVMANPGFEILSLAKGEILVLEGLLGSTISAHDVEPVFLV
jgi:hypothetical protein